ncbi:MAG: hypothetical protein QXW65_01085 [Candidatus Pacearchaeota archaeon]
MKKPEQILVENGIIYYPLLLDEVVKEKFSKENKCVVVRGDKVFIKGIDLETTIDSCSITYKEKYNKIYDGIRKQILEKSSSDVEKETNERKILEMIIFEVMPYFIKKRKKIDLSKGRATSNFSKEEILEAIRQTAQIPDSFYKKAKSPSKAYYTKLLKEIEKEIANIKINEIEGIISLDDLYHEYIDEKIKLNILNLEKEKIEEKLKKEKLEKTDKKIAEIATLLWLQEQNQFELDDFGFCKRSYGYISNDNGDPIGNEGHTVYLKIEKYALRDFDGKVYLFPACKVGVHIDYQNLYGPLVLGNYEHPFLKYQKNDQKICIGNAKIEGNTKAERIKNMLEIGKNVLLYGYFNDSKEFKPYHRLNKFPHREISENDPQIKSGKIKITNDPFIK